MTKFTLPDAESAREIIADFGGWHAFSAAWLLQQLPDEVCETFRSAAPSLGLARWLATFDDPKSQQKYLQLIETANCLIEGIPASRSFTMVALSAPPELVLDLFRQRLTTLLDRVGITLPSTNEVEECRLTLYHLVGVDALAEFRALTKCLNDLRADTPSHLSPERLVIADYPELLAADRSGQFTHALSFREFLFRRLAQLAADRGWRIRDGSPEMLMMRWTDDDMNQLVAALDEPIRTPALGDIVCEEVLASLSVDPRADTVTMSRRTIVNPDGLSCLARQPDAWPMLLGRLQRFPVLSEVLAWFGLDRSFRHMWLDIIVEKVQKGHDGRFRDLLEMTLPLIAEPRGIVLPRWPGDAEWRQLVEQSVIRSSLEEEDTESDSRRWYQETALSEPMLSVERLRGLKLPADLPRTESFEEYRERLLARIEKEVMVATEQLCE